MFTSKTKKMILILPAFFAITASACYANVGKGSRGAAFSAKGTHRRSYSLKKLIKDKKLLLVFGKSDSELSLSFIKELTEVRKKVSEKKLSILLILIKEDQKALWEFTRKKMPNFSVVADFTGKISQKYEVSFIPTYFIINSKGVITSKGTKTTAKNLLRILTAKPTK